MKILLASDGDFLIREGYQLLGIPAEQIRVGYINTASKVVTDLSYMERHRKDLVKAGYFFEEFDIVGKSKKEILDFFADKNVIHVGGGNTFYLLKAIREIGFGEIIKTLLDKGLAYVGSSAGAHIMCPTIEVASWRHGKEEWFGLEDFTAFNYVPFLVRVHYTDDMKEMVKEKIKTLKYPLRILRDGQGILVEDGKYSFKGQRDEVIL